MVVCVCERIGAQEKKTNRPVSDDMKGFIGQRARWQPATQHESDAFLMYQFQETQEVTNDIAQCDSGENLTWNKLILKIYPEGENNSSKIQVLDEREYC